MSEFYATISDVDQFALDQGQNERWDDLPDQEKTYILSLSSRDIERIHNIERSSHNIPAMLGDIWLLEACMYQVLHVMRTVNIREFMEKAKIMSSNGFNDKVISFSRPGGIMYDDTAVSLVSQVLSKKRMTKQVSFGRG